VWVGGLLQQPRYIDNSEQGRIFAEICVSGRAFISVDDGGLVQFIDFGCIGYLVVLG